jgi:uncharacterized metal-binding protein YceD (DUF177 family)
LVGIAGQFGWVGIMKIQIGGLSDGVFHFSLAVDTAALGLDEHFGHQVLAKARLEKSGSQFFLSTDIEVLGSFNCDRCLAPFHSPLTSSYRMYYITEGSGDTSIDPAELQVVPPGFSVIDLSEDVRQTVLLSVPLKLLCSESCRGLCQNCGANLNSGTCSCKETTVDTRWEQLSKLKRQNLGH